MSANHYQVLGVEPAAEGAAIRAAYRALMRIHHPDRNSDPEAQARAREITAAFAVLGDPEKREAYDERTFGMPIGHRPWAAADRRPPAPMRRVGMACVAVALALSVTLAVRPQWPAGPGPRGVATSAAKPKDAAAAPAPARDAPADISAPAAAEGSGAPEVTIAEAAAPPLAAPLALAESQKVSAPPAVEPRPVHTELREAAAAVPAAGEPVAAAPPAPPAGHRREQVERVANGFLEQSLANADWSKQQLLLSARNRASTALGLCRSDDCVTEAYLHQIRDTRTIMEGGIPSP
jgi:hypothetical protein